MLPIVNRNNYLSRALADMFGDDLPDTDRFDERSTAPAVNVKEEKNNVLISIKDTGMGIPEDKQELIFERFDQADNSLSRPNEGSGLGLPIAEEIIELHDGEIALESKVGDGSEFIIKLPIRKVSEQEIKKCNKKSDSMVERLDVEFSDIYQ